MEVPIQWTQALGMGFPMESTMQFPRSQPLFSIFNVDFLLAAFHRGQGEAVVVLYFQAGRQRGGDATVGLALWQGRGGDVAVAGAATVAVAMPS